MRRFRRVIVPLLAGLFCSSANVLAEEEYPVIGLVSLAADDTVVPQLSSTEARSTSADGRWVVYVTSAQHGGQELDSNSVNDVYLRDMWTGTVELVTVGPSGKAAGGGGTPTISDDGCRIAFDTTATLIPDFPQYLSKQQAYVRDRCASPPTITLVSVKDNGAAFNLEAHAYAISGDGKHVLVGSRGDLSGAGADCSSGSFTFSGCLFVRDLDTSHTGRVDISTDGAGAESGGAFFSRPDISDDGRLVVFATASSNLVDDDTNGDDDAFVHDRDSDGDAVMDEPGGVRTTRISVKTGGDEVFDHDYIGRTAIAGDGSVAAFCSFSTTLLPDDLNPGGIDVFVRDLASGELERFGRAPEAGAPENSSCCGNNLEALSDDGSKVLFTSAGNVPLPPPAVGSRGTSDVYVRDRIAGETIAVTQSNYDPDRVSVAGGITDDGSVVVFWSEDRLTDADTNEVADVYAAGHLDTATTTTVTTTTTTLPRSCGDPVPDAAPASDAAPVFRAVKASDALRVLRAAVGSESCENCVCDVNGSGAVTASDALATLKLAVGQAIDLNCPPC